MRVASTATDRATMLLPVKLRIRTPAGGVVHLKTPSLPVVPAGVPEKSTVRSASGWPPLVAATRLVIVTGEGPGGGMTGPGPVGDSDPHAIEAPSTTTAAAKPQAFGNAQYDEIGPARNHETSLCH
jgi:hypothetical protein